MCHTVPLRKNKVPAFMPPISQIPTIGCSPEDIQPKCVPTQMFKSTDTPYIQLAKMGGRADLLCFKENQPSRGEPLPTCRCDWYYLEDNANEMLAQAKEQPKHEFKVPFYMTDQVHKSEKDLPKPIVQSTPPPLSVPRKPKKCGKLPAHRPGYADYNKKLQKINIPYNPPVHNTPVRFPKVCLLLVSTNSLIYIARCARL